MGKEAVNPCGEMTTLLLFLVLSDRAKLLTLGALVVADSWTTYQALQQGGRECNPIYPVDRGSSFAEILALQAAAQVGLHYGLKELGAKRTIRAECWGRAVVVGWNLSQIKVRW